MGLENGEWRAAGQLREEGAFWGKWFRLLPKLR